MESPRHMQLSSPCLSSPGLSSGNLPPLLKPTYNTSVPVPNIPENNQVKLLDYRGAKIAAFTVECRELICLPQAFELFLKNLVGGLHTVYTKLKRLEIVPVVCNVEQVRILRGLGAIQPGVNRCKLIAPDEFDTLYEDCTNSSARPGRPPKRSMTMSPDFTPIITADIFKRGRFDTPAGFKFPTPNNPINQLEKKLFGPPPFPTPTNYPYPHYPPHLAGMIPALFSPFGHTPTGHNPAITAAGLAGLYPSLGNADSCAIKSLIHDRPQSEGGLSDCSESSQANKLPVVAKEVLDSKGSPAAAAPVSSASASATDEEQTNPQKELSKSEVAESLLFNSILASCQSKHDHTAVAGSHLADDGPTGSRTENNGLESWPDSLQLCLSNIEMLLRATAERAKNIDRKHREERAALQDAARNHRSKAEEMAQELVTEKQRRAIVYKKWKKEKKIRERLEEIMNKLQQGVALQTIDLKSIEDLPQDLSMSKSGSDAESAS